MKTPTPHSEPVALATAVAILVNATVLIAGKRAGLGEGEIAAVQSGVAAVAAALARRQVWSPATVDARTATKTKRATKKRGR